MVKWEIKPWYGDNGAVAGVIILSILAEEKKLKATIK
jgi:hypothetical protein